MNRRALSSGLVCLLLLSCGKDSGTDPTDGGGVNFPNIPSDALAAMCIRGQIVPPKAVTGNVNQSDCQPYDVPDYREGWRVRVKSSGMTTFSLTSDFYGELFLYAVDPHNIEGMTLLERDFDDGPGETPLIVRNLLSGSEYWIYVEAEDYYGGPSSYTLSVTQQ